MNIVYKSGSVFIRASLKSCSGDFLLPADVTAMKLNIFELLDPQGEVSAYTNVSIPLTAMLSAPLTGCDGFVYNFEYNPYDGENLLFPKRQTTYVIEIVWFDADGIPTAHQLEVNAL